MDFQSKPQKNPEFVARKIAGELILIPLHRQIDNIDSIFNANETACSIWDLIDGKKSIEEIRLELLTQFDVPEESLNHDLQTFFEQLQEINAVQFQ
jgi:hypothetical protein